LSLNRKARPQTALRKNKRGTDNLQPGKLASKRYANTEKSSLLSDLVAANRILDDQGVVDGYGHVSVRHPSKPDRFYISRWLAPDLVTETDIVELDLACIPVPGEKRKLYSERFIHGEIYRARPDVQSVVHTHAPAVVLMGVCSEPLRPLYHMAAFLEGGVPVFDIRKSSGMTNMLISDASRGKALARALGGKSAALMRGHGGIAVGSSLAQAVGRSVYLKINSEMQARLLGRKIKFLVPEEAHLAETVVQNFPKDWELWKRKAMARD
jgi:ribulose-5-phosphate 4-epimerase/fuculose-1-phosphate aldolase